MTKKQITPSQYRVERKDLFVILSHKFIREILLKTANAEVRVYLALQLYANKNDKETWVSQAAIARDVGLSKRMVRDVVLKLEKNRIITVHRDNGSSNLIKILKY